MQLLPVWLDAALWALTGAAYAIVALAVWRRPTAPELRRGKLAFAGWWIGLGATSFLSAIFAAALAAGLLSPPAASALLHAAAVGFALAFWGLAGYLVVLFTGTDRELPQLAAVSLLMALLLFYVIAWLQPEGGFSGAAGFGIRFGRGLSRSAASSLALLLGAPAVLAAVACIRLFGRTSAGLPRSRIALLGLAFGAWGAWAGIDVLLQLRVVLHPVAWGVDRALALAAPLVGLVAYRPPRALRSGRDDAPSR